MKMEKFYNSIFYKTCEKIYQLVVLNMLTFIVIIAGLGVFTLFPAIVSLIVMLKSCKHENNIPLFKTYFKIFIKEYKKAELLSLFYFILVIFGIVNTYYFYCWTLESTNIILGILYYLSLVIDVIIIFTIINACFVYVYFPYLTKKKIFKYAFTLIAYIMWKFLVLLVILIGLIYLNALFIYIMPFISISLYCYCFYLLVDNDYYKIILKDKKSLNASDYLNV